jgi:hypothetical protein
VLCCAVLTISSPRTALGSFFPRVAAVVLASGWMVVSGQQAGWMVMVWLPAGTEGDGLKKVLMCGSCSGLFAASRATHGATRAGHHHLSVCSKSVHKLLFW